MLEPFLAFRETPWMDGPVYCSSIRNHILHKKLAYFMAIKGIVHTTNSDIIYLPSCHFKPILLLFDKQERS